MSTERLVLPGDLDLDARREFITEAITVIGSAATAGTEVELDCSAVESVGPVDDAVIGMLVVVARASHRHGARLALVNAPKPMRAQFEAVRRRAPVRLARGTGAPADVDRRRRLRRDSNGDVLERHVHHVVSRS